MHRLASMLVLATLACAGVSPAQAQQGHLGFPPPRGMHRPPPRGRPPPGGRFGPPPSLPPPPPVRAPSPAPVATLPEIVQIDPAPVPALPGMSKSPDHGDGLVVAAPREVQGHPSAPSQAQVSRASAASSGVAAEVAVERAATHSLPWLWLLALGGLLLAWWTAWRRSHRLKEETERLTRQQRVLRSAHSHLQRKSEELQHLSMHDPLTGTLNRQAFGTELRDRIDHLAKYSLPLSLIVFDLDHFKRINDRQGHLVGDMALALVVGVVHEHLVSEDLFGRFGGDEFMVACPGQAAPHALALAETLRKAVAVRAPLADPPIPVLTLSLGVAQADPEQGYEIDDLFARADAALYVAKHRGRNATVAADAETVAQAVPGSVRRHL